MKKDNDKDKLNKKIGARLRCVREEAGFSAKQIAELLGISETHYRRIEKGHHTLVPEKIVTLHTFLNVDPLFLLTGERRAEGGSYAERGGFLDRRAVVMEELMRYYDAQEKAGADTHLPGGDPETAKGRRSHG